jgi:hypothetical protein
VTPDSIDKYPGYSWTRFSKKGYYEWCRISPKDYMIKRRKVLGDITNQAALPGRIRSSTIYRGCKAYNTTLCASGSCFRKYHDYIAKKKE